jgi:hypothetical protein
MLKKITLIFEEHVPRDISQLKIYFDTINHNYRRKFYCCECGKFMQCRCFEYLAHAMIQAEEGMICDECGFNEVRCDMTIYDCLELLTPDQNLLLSAYLRTNIVSKLQVSESFSNGSDKEKSDRDFINDVVMLLTDDYEEEKSDVLDFIIDHLLTVEQKQCFFSECWDESSLGDECEI